VSKTLTLGGARRLELIGLVFNVFGTDSFGVGATPWQLNATSNSFGTLNTVYPRQQAEHQREGEEQAHQSEEPALLRRVHPPGLGAGAKVKKNDVLAIVNKAQESYAQGCRLELE
jgi:hypothetical protein